MEAQIWTSQRRALSYSGAYQQKALVLVGDNLSFSKRKNKNWASLVALKILGGLYITLE